MLEAPSSFESPVTEVSASRTALISAPSPSSSSSDCRKPASSRMIYNRRQQKCINQDDVVKDLGILVDEYLSFSS